MILWQKHRHHGVIYQSRWQKTSGTVIVSRSIKFNLNLTNVKHLLSFIPWLKLIHLLGKSLIVGSFTFIILTFTPLLANEIQYRLKPTPSPSQFGYLLQNQLTPPEEKRFQLIIPKIDINVKVFANIDPNNPQEYQQILTQGVAHAQGSGLPGESDYNQTVYLFAHSTDAPYNIGRYNAVFYQLKNLEAGDEIIVWFWGKRFVYQVVKQEILSRTDTQYFQPQIEQHRLVLQTCWPPGTTLKQLVVIAQPAGDTP
ncbi:sortase [Patescibacteria group bacterium]|nr:sortase [Patescibacteria group bacterium]MBU1931271.1 sortase [Patescibacteria group bacterium]